MNGLACATETLTMLEIRQRDRLVDYYFVVNYFLNQYARHGCDRLPGREYSPECDRSLYTTGTERVYHITYVIMWYR